MTNQDLLDVMEKHPELTYSGFANNRDWDYYDRGLSPGEKRDRKEKCREELKRVDVEWLSVIKELFSTVAKTKQINQNSGSYGLKHVAEHILGDYVSNGTLIAVMLHLGFKHADWGINAGFNASEKDLKKLRVQSEKIQEASFAVNQEEACHS